MQDVVEDHCRCGPRECGAAGYHFVQHRAEGEQVGARIEVFAARLLGRHVCDGADRRTGAG